MFNIVFIIPTGIGAEIGGHAGDANPVAKLFGSICDELILHPNVVNASDINEMPNNALYVEGSILDRFLEGKIELQKVRSNKVLVVTNKITPDGVNAVSAARVTLGLDVSIVELKTPLEMIGEVKDGIAGGIVTGYRELIEQVKQYKFDALAIHTPITVDKEKAWDYLKNGGTNLWGGIEARTSKIIANALNKPVAHAPVESDIFKDFNEIVDPRMSAETVSVCYLHCVLKGLHKAPRIGKGLSVDDIDFLVSPPCFGRPHKACLEKGIPIIIVKENKTVLEPTFHSSFVTVENYWEAAGVLACMKVGVSRESVRRPIDSTEVRRSSGK